MLSKFNQISEKHFTAFAVGLFLVSIFPLLVLGAYNVMGADDYSYGISVHDTWLSTGSFWQCVQCAVEHTRAFYYSWQGTYTSCFLMSMCPMHFNYYIGYIVPVIMIGMLSASTYLLLRQIFVKWFGCGGGYIYVGCMLLFLFWQTIDSPYDGIYWYNGATHYILMQSVWFFMLTAVSGIVWTDSKRNQIIWCILASLLGVLAGGGNLVTGLQAEIVLGLLCIYMFCRKREKLIWIGIPLFCHTAGFAFNVLAPGNVARGGEMEQGYGAITSILLSFYQAFIYMKKWTSVMLILVWIAVLPIMWRHVRASQKKFKYPLAVAAGIFCVVAAMFTPTLYAIGEVGIGRINNIIQMTYYIGLFSVTAYWLGWYSHRKKFAEKYEKSINNKTRAEQTGKVVIVSAILLILAVWTLTVNKNTYTGISALRSVVKGEAQTFYEEEMIRHDMYLDPEIDYVIVERHTVRPYLFADRDLDWDSGDWINQSVTHYYHKDKVVRRVE